MKLRFVKSVVVDIQKPRLNEIWDKYIQKWDEINADSLNYDVEGMANITTYDGDVLLDVPADSFEVVSSP